MKDFRRYLTPLTTRKAMSWDACESRDELSKWHYEMLEQLPVIETEAKPYEDFLGETPPRECVVRVGQRHFYVNPEGYSYARYAFEFKPHS